MNLRQFLCALVIAVLSLSTEGRAQSDHRPLRIGVITPLSGGMATIGTALKNGIELAQRERPDLFEHVSILIEDDQFDSKKSLSAYQKLRTESDVHVILGFGDSLGYSVGQKCKQDRVPLINFNFDPGAARGNEFLIRAMNPTQEYMNALGEYWRRRGATRFVVVRAESPFFNAMSESFHRAIGDGAVITELGGFSPSDTDFKPVILRLRERGAVPIGLFLSPEQMLQFTKQARELYVSQEYFGTDLFETAAGIGEDSRMFEGAVYPDNNVSDSFRHRYREAFQNEAQLTFAGSGYDMALLVGEVLRSLEVYRGEEILREFKKVQNREGVLGRFSFVRTAEAGGYYQYPVRVKRIQGKVGVPVED